MGMKKRILFQKEAKTLKNGRKRKKNGYCVNSPLEFYVENLGLGYFPVGIDVTICDLTEENGAIVNRFRPGNPCCESEFITIQL